MNVFGGEWTEVKIDVLTKYTTPYLTIMAKAQEKYSKRWKLIYFDGFAGSGKLDRLEDESGAERLGAALRILEIDKPIRFTYYYLVELDKGKADELDNAIKTRFPDLQGCHVVRNDANKKLQDLAKYLREDKSNRKALVFIDPFGMQVDWDSIEALKGLGVDLWILVPVGLANRLLNRNVDTMEEHLWQRLEASFGLTRTDIQSHFYTLEQKTDLFGQNERTIKVGKSNQKISDLWRERFSSIFKYVSTPLPIKAAKNNYLFDFLFASNNKAAEKIASEIIQKTTK